MMNRVGRGRYQIMKLTPADLPPDETVDCKTCVSENPANNNLL